MLNKFALGIMLGWILLVIIFMVVLMRKYTFGKWTIENPNPYQNETLGIPPGVFRGILTLSMIFIVMLLEVNTLSFDAKDLVSGDQQIYPEKGFEQLMTAFQLVIAFYFGSKAVQQISGAGAASKKNDAAAPGFSEQNDSGAIG